MIILATLAVIFGTLIGIANFPQAFKIFKRKSAKDISILSVSIFFTGSFIWTLYGIELKNFPIIITNGLAFISLCFVVLGWTLYGRK
jgi:MtN3 and saliva related transmembrane protein